MANFEIEDFTPASIKSNEYDPAVKALVEAGEGKSIVLRDIPADEVAKHKRRFSEAAARVGKSPRVREVIESEDKKTVALRVTLGERIVQKRKDAAEGEAAPAVEGEAAPAVESDDTPTDAPVEKPKRERR